MLNCILCQVLHPLPKEAGDDLAAICFSDAPCCADGLPRWDSDLAFRSKASWGYSEQFMDACRAELTVSEPDIREHDFFVLDSGGEVIGFCALMKCDTGDAGEGELIDVFIDPARQQEGHGRRLVEHAKEIARERGWHSLRVAADPNAFEFYASCGAVQVGTVPSESIAGRELPFMKIPLHQPERNPSET